jgi:[histone H3]-lysine36 N-dimethyltransferase SETMAR
MSTPLEDCTTEEQRSVVRFLHAEGVKTSEIIVRMKKMYGINCLSVKNIYKWVIFFKDGRKSVSDNPRPGCPIVTNTTTMAKEIEKIIFNNRKIKISEISNKVNISYGPVFKIVHENLKFKKICSRWVPRYLTREQKLNRAHIAKAHLDRYSIEGNSFLGRIVTGDETWCHHYDPESKRASMEWRHSGSPKPKKMRIQRSLGKVLLTIFWDESGPLVLDFLGIHERMNCEKYCDILKNKLKPSIRTKRRGKLRNGIVFQHDNARPHSANLTKLTLHKLGFEVLEHPPYSPDLAPSDYFLFGLLKRELKGRKFDDDNELIQTVQKFFKDLPKKVYKDGIFQLVKRWKLCVEKQGDYIE